CFWTFASIAMGCLFSLDTYFSQSIGARDEKSLTRYLGQSWWSCIILTVLSSLLVAVGAFLYAELASPSPTREAFLTYIRYVVWCVPAIFIFFVLQRYWQAQHKVIAFSLIIVAANILNLVVALGLGMGLWGLPRLEVRGLA